MEPRPRRLLTISQAAARLNVHPDTVRAWADREIVPVVRTPTGHRRFDPQDIERIRAEMGVKGSAMDSPALANDTRAKLEEAANRRQEQLAHQRREARIRRALRREGLALRKSRLRGKPQSNDLGEYGVIDLNLDAWVVGSRFDHTLDDIEEWMRQRA